MPSKENDERVKVLFFQDGKTAFDLRIEEGMEIREILEPGDELALNDNGLEVTLKSESTIKFSEMLMVFCGYAKPYQVLQNNWRRMHGLPMRRRKKR